MDGTDGPDSLSDRHLSSNLNLGPSSTLPVSNFFFLFLPKERHREKSFPVQRAELLHQRNIYRKKRDHDFTLFCEEGE